MGGRLLGLFCLVLGRSSVLSPSAWGIVAGRVFARLSVTTAYDTLRTDQLGRSKRPDRHS